MSTFLWMPSGVTAGITGSSGFIIGAWIYPTAQVSRSTVIAFSSNTAISASYARIMLNDSTLRFEFNISGGANYTFDTTYALNTWTHVALVAYNTVGGCISYVNGARVNATAFDPTGVNLFFPTLYFNTACKIRFAFVATGSAGFFGVPAADTMVSRLMNSVADCASISLHCFPLMSGATRLNNWSGPKLTSPGTTLVNVGVPDDDGNPPVTWGARAMFRQVKSTGALYSGPAVTRVSAISQLAGGTTAAVQAEKQGATLRVIAAVGGRRGSR